jgi:sugar phosphate isomerase/epimerase
MRAMTRRTFFASLAAPLAAQGAPQPIGLNTYCLRAWRWTDAELIEYAASLKMDAIFLQDSLDPKAQDPAHWPAVKEMARAKGLHLETGGGGILPKSKDGLPKSIETLKRNITRAQAMGSPIVRAVLSSDRASLPAPPEEAMEWAVAVLRGVRDDCQRAGLKIAIEIHKDFQAWEHQQIIEAAGKEFVGTYLDSGNPVFVMEDPLETLEVMAPYVVTAHLRDSVVYEHRNGIAVQWVPLGEGNIDFKGYCAKLAALCPNVHVYVKPITGRVPTILPIYTDAFWKMYPKAKAPSLARFLAIAKAGAPYERNMVIEDVPGRPTPPHFAEALKFQQKEHMERSIAYAQKTLHLGRRWRTA